MTSDDIIQRLEALFHEQYNDCVLLEPDLELGCDLALDENEVRAFLFAIENAFTIELPEALTPNTVQDLIVAIKEAHE